VRIAGVELLDPRPVGGGDIGRSFAARLADGSTVFAKSLPDSPPDFFTAEARGLALLRVDAGPPVPAVRAVAHDGLILDWVEPGSPSRQAAQRFGQQLARLHATSSSQFGAAEPGFVGTVRIDNAPAPDWPTFFAERRLRPAMAAARRAGSLDDADASAISEVIDNLGDLGGPPEPPALIHGDLWAGNLLWADSGEVWLVDAAAAHHGHRETDLAMLALFGAPFHREILAAYDAASPLATGWESRIPLHQLHPLLIHAVLFGGGYGARAGAAARRLLA
jgi:fructosamine-3-kinase